MVDLDEKVVNICREYLPEWGGDNVMNNDRFELVIADAHAYLLNSDEMFDVMIMDISDPIEAGPGITLYTKEFYEHALTRLNPNGVFVTQAGAGESVPVDFTEVDPHCFAPITNTLKAVFHCSIPYSVNIPSYGGDWGFVMAFNKSGDENDTAEKLENEWIIPERGLIDQMIEDRIEGGADALRMYDGISHTNLFSLSKPLRKFLANDDRIITKDNPIFMYWVQREEKIEMEICAFILSNTRFANTPVEGDGPA